MFNWDVAKYLFKCLCIIATLLLVVMWIQRYLLDEDTSVIESRSYLDTEDDLIPVMSMCFKESFNDELFERFGENITGLDYEKYLLGNSFDKRMLMIDYEKVSMNISDFVLSHVVAYKNGSDVRDDWSGKSWKPLYHTHTWINWGQFVKCFGIEIIDKDVYNIKLYMKREIFPDTIRPQWGGFAVLFHYPNQMISSIHTITRQWGPRDKASNYVMDFNIKGMEVSLHRYKESRHNCIQDWRNFDNIILREHVKSIGCKQPYQLKGFRWPLCDTKEKMKQAEFPEKPEGLPPCREIESIAYQMAESEAGKNGECAEFCHDWFAVVYRILKPRFKMIVQKKEVDFQSLVGYVGGYTGIFLGIALAQIPEIMLTTIGYLKKAFFLFFNLKLKNNSQIE